MVTANQYPSLEIAIPLICFPDLYPALPKVCQIQNPCRKCFFQDDDEWEEIPIFLEAAFTPFQGSPINRLLCVISLLQNEQTTILSYLQTRKRRRIDIPSMHSK